ncbi:hypothetical protein [Sphingomonas sp.]|uniref:helix-turn-helix transcriptional regulator n=1 Tax=Sphingomonas sp. TaxID=28214 RepID=UPI002DF6C4D5|nr:hypothetical protein [Sphingomonas sp.]
MASAPPIAAGERDTLAPAARLIVDSVAEALAADGATIVLRRKGGGETLLAHTGALAADARPPRAPFLLADDNSREPRWRHGSDGLWLTSSIDIAGGELSILFFARFSQEPSSDVGRIMALFVPGLQALGSAVEQRRDAALRTASYEAALDRSELGIILLGSDASLIFANSIAEQLLDSGDYLRRKGDGISARGLGDAVRLQIAIEHVCANEDHEETPVVLLKRRHPLRPLLVCVSSAQCDREAASDAGAILRIIDPDRDVLQGLEPICAHYRLSPVETRLACQLAKGATLDDAAATLRIKPQTARSYLKQVFLKTDTNRQPELIGLLIASAVRALPTGRFRIV